MTNFNYLVFNHVPKCAGTSIRYMFYNGCKNNDFFNQYPMYIPPYTHGNICLEEHPHFFDAIHVGTRLFLDHSKSYFLEKIFNLNINNTYRILSIRNPVDRFISHMIYFDKINPDDCSIDLLKLKVKRYGNIFIEYLTTNLILEQKDYIDSETKYNIAKKEIKKYNFIFHFEKFSESIQQFNSINPFNINLVEEKLNVSIYNNYIAPKKILIIESYLYQDLKLLDEYY